MADKQSVEVADLFSSIANQLRADRSRINQLDQQGGNGNHGDNMVANFEMLANELRGTRGQDASAQLRRAAELMRQRGRGQSAQLYAEGLQEASQRVGSAPGISIQDLVPLLQGLLGGVQRRSDVPAGQGSMLDSLLPGIMGFVNARSQGRSATDAALDAINAAMSGANQTQRAPAQYGQYRRDYNQSWQDPGASSGASLLQGLFKQFLG